MTYLLPRYCQDNLSTQLGDTMTSYRLREAITKLASHGMEPSIASDSNRNMLVYITQEYTPSGTDYACIRKARGTYRGQSIGSAWYPRRAARSMTFDTAAADIVADIEGFHTSIEESR